MDDLRRVQFGGAGGFYVVRSLPSAEHYAAGEVQLNTASNAQIVMGVGYSTALSQYIAEPKVLDFAIVVPGEAPDIFNTLYTLDQAVKAAASLAVEVCGATFTLPLVTATKGVAGLGAPSEPRTYSFIDGLTVEVNVRVVPADARVEYSGNGGTAIGLL